MKGSLWEMAAFGKGQPLEKGFLWKRAVAVQRQFQNGTGEPYK